MKFNKIPVLLDLHDLSPELFKSKWMGKKHLILYLFNIWIEKVSCFIADHIITTSTGFVNALISRGINKNKVDLIINFPSKLIVRTKKLIFKETINNNLKIVYHGTVAKRFGLHIPIIAMTQIRKYISDAQLHIYGSYDDSYKEELNELIKKLGLTESVRLFDSLPFEKIIPKVQEYDLGLVPYIESEFMNLAISTKSFEYAKLKIPMVASDLKPQRYYFDDNCVSYFKPGDPEDLAEKVLELCLTKDLMEKKANEAYKVIIPLTNGEIENKYVSLVDKLISK